MRETKRDYDDYYYLDDDQKFCPGQILMARLVTWRILAGRL